ncbi:MAG: ABC transporter ATP-binding protein [Candidatus Diapherotrites archaeon]|nr:ABC transporter ATP-binding protein [Candidatus Diapherotrites archaeon]
MRVKIENLSKSYFGLSWKMENVFLEIPEGKVTAVVGPSGCGKTTLLRLLAGLEFPDQGNIFFDEKNVTSLSAEKREVGLVFQNEALFSHLTVFENVAFGLKMKQDKNIVAKTKSALVLVHLLGLDNRSVIQLSGGEKKRVALARALAVQPKLLLLDEPLNGLDAGLKEKIKELLKELWKKTKLGLIWVAHDLDDVFYLADWVIVMNDGKIEQAGSPIDLFLKPKNEFVKNFFAQYQLIQAKSLLENGKSVIQGTIRLNTVSEKGTPYINVKKTNYKFLPDA